MFEDETISERQIEDWFDNFIVEYANQNDKEKELFSSPKYILWLNEFTKEHESFSDDEWLFETSDISKNDLEQVQHLGTIYNLIESYANKNYIFPDYNDLGKSYYVKLGSNNYEIGMTSFLDETYFCNRVDLDDRNLIDFNDVINGKRQNNIEFINDDLKKLSCIVETLYKSGVPLEAISMTVNQKIEDLEVRSEYEDIKILTK